jgi:molybdopterin molybdotransferase
VRLEDAVDRLMDATVPLPVESVPLWEANGRVAAEDVDAPGPVPHFARPAMDGYVCHDSDVRDASSQHPVVLRITGAVRMGDLPGRGPGPGEAWSITTGAPMPERGDRVLPVETVRRDDDQLRVDQPPGRKTHVAGPGETIRQGARLVRAGEVVLPAAAGALTACGVGTLRVYRRPRVAVVATGDELIDAVEGRAPLPPGHVFNSNTVTLGGLLREAGCDVDYRGIVRDSPQEMRTAFAALGGQYDVILSTGGVSIGRYDAVHRTWLDLGARRIVGRVDLKPGGPFFAGRLGDSWAVGLSGTPVACLAAFYLLARPLLARLAGRRHAVRPVREVILAGPFPLATDRMRVLWARRDLTQGRISVALLRDPASGELAGLLRANALVLVPPGSPPLPSGSRVSALLLDQDEDHDHLTIDPPRRGPLVIGVVGVAGSGKTTVIADLVRKLAVHGVRAVAVKHAAHGFDLDREGSDSARLASAGAALVMLAGPAETLLRIAAPLRDPDLAATLATVIAEHVWDSVPALVLVEGFQHPSGPVIMVGPQKSGTTAGEVLAVVPAVNGMNGERLAAELERVLGAVLCRVRASHVPERPSN